MFRLFFSLAIGLGILDAITKRKRLPERLVRVRYLEALRAVRAANEDFVQAMEPARSAISGAGRDVLRAHRRVRFLRLTREVRECLTGLRGRAP